MYADILPIVFKAVVLIYSNCAVQQSQQHWATSLVCNCHLCLVFSKLCSHISNERMRVAMWPLDPRLCSLEGRGARQSGKGAFHLFLSLLRVSVPPTITKCSLTEEQVLSKLWTAQGLLYCGPSLEIAARLV